jgi:hypothetical protein
LGGIVTAEQVAEIAEYEKTLTTQIRSLQAACVQCGRERDALRAEIERLSISREADMERAWNEGHQAGQSYATVVDYDDPTDYSVNPYSVLPDTAITIAPDALPNGWVHVGQGSRRCTQHGVCECDLHHGTQAAIAPGDDL